MKNKIKKYRKFILRISLVLFGIWYYNCIDNQLFNDPVSLVLVDKNGNLLSAHVAKDEQWRFPEAAQINHKFKQAIITFEDRRFYKHIGVDFWALGRAVKSNLSSGRVVSGASTLTMQVIRLSRKNPDRSFFEKLTEMFRATRLELKYSKNEILALYASHAPFGGNVVGLDAASWRYYGKSQDKLSWSEVALLAVLPNAPGLIHPGKNRNRLLKKRDKLLNQLLEEGHIDSTTCLLAKLEPLPEKPVSLPNHTPHLMNYFLVKNKDNKIQTSIDFHWQNTISDIIEKHTNNLNSKAIHNASALVIEVKTGKVISYVGNSKKIEKQHENEVDMIRSKRSTGSILKPLLYAEMLDNGMILPQSIIPDIPVNYQGYSPKNFNLTYDGIIPANEMVSRSLNIPAVNMLNQYGVNRFVAKLKSFGFTSIQKNGSHYGLPLILGGAEVSPWELGVIYTGLVQKLMGYNQAISVTKNDSLAHPYLNYYPNKMAIYQMFEAMLEVSRPNEDQSWKVFENEHKIAWKTGTSFGGRDAWAVGCSPEYTVVIWTGNSNGEGRPDLTGFGISGPILFDIFNVLPIKNTWFNQPTNSAIKLSICCKSGYKANRFCESTQSKLVSSRGLDSEPCSYCYSVALDSSGAYSVDDCDYSPLNRIEKTYFVLNPIEASYYRKKHADYKEIPPSISKSGNFSLVYPKPNAKIYLPKVDSITQSSMVVKASSTENSDQLFWTLDDTFIGSTIEDHKFAIQPKLGKHVLSVVNQKGKKVNVEFEVVN